jgi:hypothetical protein
MGMKSLKVLWLLIPLALAGCSSGPKWDKAELEQKIKADSTQQLKQKRIGGECTEVRLVQDSENQNKFTGYAQFDDGSTRGLNVTVDPNTGDYVSEPTS